MSQEVTKPDGINKPTITAIAMLLGVVSGGITTLVGGVMAYVFRGDTPADSWEISHYRYHIRTFWGTLVGAIVGVILTVILIGIVILLVVGLWALIRSIVALMKAMDGQPMPNPDTWGI